MTNDSYSNETQQQMLCCTKTICDKNASVVQPKSINKCMRAQKISIIISNNFLSIIFCLLFMFNSGNVVHAQTGEAKSVDMSMSNRLILTTITTTVDYLNNITTIEQTVNDISDQPPMELETNSNTNPGIAFASDDPRFDHGEMQEDEMLHENIKVETIVKRGEIVNYSFADYIYSAVLSTKQPSNAPTDYPTDTPTASSTASPTISPTSYPTSFPTDSPTTDVPTEEPNVVPVAIGVLTLPPLSAPTLSPLPDQTNSQIASAKEEVGNPKASSKLPIILALIGGVAAILAVCVVAAVFVMKNKKEDYEDGLQFDEESPMEGENSNHSFPSSFLSKDTNESHKERYLVDDEESGRGGVDFRTWNRTQESSISITHDVKNNIESFEVQRPW